jgi:DNA-binding response OmpR family regulator
MTRILLIDDDAKLGAPLGDYLQERGFLVQVENEETREIAESFSNEYSIVTLDVMIPQLNGLEVRNIRRKLGTLADGDRAFRRFMGRGIGL